MKRYFFIVAAILMLPVFFSCGGNAKPDKPDTPTTPTTPTTPENPPVPSDPQIEFRKTFKFGNSIFSASSNGAYVAILDKAFTKAGDERKIVTGTYSFDNSSKTWSFTSLGKIELLEDKKIAYTPSGGARTVYENVEITEIVSNESSEAYKVNGIWVITQTILNMPDRNVNNTYPGTLNLNVVEKDARDLGIDFKFHMDDNMVVDKVIITDSMLAASFKNGQAYAAEHNLRLGNSFKLHEFTYDLDGTATVQFVEDLCVIKISTTLDNSAAEIMLTLQPSK
jgi:hypothetical protein